MNGLRTRLSLDADRQQLHNRISDTGDRIVGAVCCIGLALFVLYELAGRYL